MNGDEQNKYITAAEILADDTELISLGRDVKAYDGGPIIYAPGESILERVRKLLEKQTNKEARGVMLRGVLRLDHLLDQLDLEGKSENSSFDKILIDLVIQVATENVNALPKEDQGEALKFINEKIKNPGMLLPHLEETGDSMVAFFDNTKKVFKGGQGILTSREIVLMEFVARTHDICKLLGSMDAQIDPDHEIIYREVVGSHLVGKSFKGKGGALVFSAEDVEFVKAVVGQHEDIWREAAFAKEAESLKNTPGPVTREIAIARGRSILHFIDIFGNAVRFDQDKLKIVDKNAFDRRFIDLFRRHIDLPIIDNSGDKPFEWQKAKVFRPIWGFTGEAGMIKVFDLLKEEWGINVDPNLVPTVKNGVLKVLKEARSAIQGIQSGDQRYTYGYKTKEMETKKRKEEQEKIERELLDKLHQLNDIILILEKES